MLPQRRDGGGEFVHLNDEAAEPGADLQRSVGSSETARSVTRYAVWSVFARRTLSTLNRLVLRALRSELSGMMAKQEMTAHRPPVALPRVRIRDEPFETVDR